MAFLSSLALALSLFLPLLVLKKLNIFSRSPLDNIPGPPPASFIKGHMNLLFGRNADEWRKGLYENYGRVVKLLNIFSIPQLFIFDPVALHTVLIKEHHIFEEPQVHLDSNLMMFGHGLTSVEGEQHKRQRKLLNPAFSPAHLRTTLPIMYSVTYRLRDAVTSRLNGSEWTDVDMLSWISRAALELIGQAGLGRSLDSLDGDKASPYGEAMKSLVPALVDLVLWRRFLPTLINIGSASFRRCVVEHIPSSRVQIMREIIDIMDVNARELVAERMSAVRGDRRSENALDADLDEKDIISRLIRENMDASADEALSEEEVVGQISTLVFAATDTTSSALSRILHLLAEHQDVQTRLREEIVTARREKGDLSFDDLFALPYLEAVCRETLRLYAPVSFVSKTAREDTVLPLRTPVQGLDGRELKNVPVPKGTNVIVGIAALNRDKALWGPDALEWKPERWLNPLPEAVVTARIPGVYSNMLTFLGGGRACIGFKFSQCEMKVVLSILLESFAFRLPDVEIGWNTASVHYPSVKNNAKARLPMKVKKL